MFCQFREIVYLCTRNREITFLERYKIFILERGVRFPYGLQ